MFKKSKPTTTATTATSTTTTTHEIRHKSLPESGIEPGSSCTQGGCGASGSWRQQKVPIFVKAT